jgi:hypothetical protein
LFNEHQSLKISIHYKTLKHNFIISQGVVLIAEVNGPVNTPVPSLKDLCRVWTRLQAPAAMITSPFFAQPAPGFLTKTEKQQRQKGLQKWFA